MENSLSTNSNVNVPFSSNVYVISPLLFKTVTSSLGKTPPQADVTYSTTEITNEDVVATLSFDKENITILSKDVSNIITNLSSRYFTS